MLQGLVLWFDPVHAYCTRIGYYYRSSGMSRVQQMKYVEKYLSNKGIRGGNLSDIYMSVLFPAAVVTSSFVLCDETYGLYW